MKIAESAPRPVALIIATAVGVLLGWWTYARLDANLAPFAVDFTYPWRAAGHLLSGRDPYQSMPVAPYGQAGPFLYPLPAAVLAMPVGRLNASVAGAIFFGVSTALFAYAVARQALWQLLTLVSPSFVLAYYNIQWSPIIVASALLPLLGWIGVAKPNLGLIAFAYRPRWSTLILGVVFVVLTIAWLPAWPSEWLQHVRLQQAPHEPAVLWPFGLVGLAGLLRWRTPGGRVLTAITLVPTSSLPYDHLFLWLTARTWKESAALSAVGWVAYVIVLATAPHDLTTRPGLVQCIISLGMYLPAAVLVMRRPNEGTVPAWLERRAELLPRWLRGASAS